MESTEYENEAGINTYDFSSALDELKKGKKISRLGWNWKDMYLKLQTPDEHSFMTLPYIYIAIWIATRVPWLASQSDLLAEDWEIID